MRRSIHGLTILCLLLSFSGLGTARDLHVSKTGDDANSGDKDAPLATIQEAIDRVRGMSGGTIWIGPGEYYLEQGIALTAEHSGEPEQPLTIRALEPGKTRLTGARVVQDFRPISVEEADSLISEAAKGRVLVADLKSQGFPLLSDMPAQHRAHGREEVVFGDQPMQSARWPNDEFAVFTEVIDPGASKPVHWVTREVYRPGSFRFPGDRAKRWSVQRGVWLHGFWCYDWCDEALKVGSFDADTGELRLAVKHAYGIGNSWKSDSKRRFYVLHVFEELDTPGEYYLDRDNERLYFWPPGDVTKTPVRLTLCPHPLIQADNVAHLVLRDLVIENGRNRGVYLKNCQHGRIEDCLVRNMGQSGINLSGRHMAAVRCEVTGTASYGISVYGGDRKTLTPGHCEVRDCYIHHVGRLDWMGGRGITLGGCGNRVANNLIHDGPTGAVSYGGNEHVLELNEIYNVCLHYSDVGVFYTGRDWSSRGNTVRWNYIHDISNNAGHGSSGIYLDDCDSGDTVVGNIVFRGVGRGVLLGGGRDNRIQGNIFVSLPIGIHVDARGPRGITLDKPGSWNLLAKCEAVGYQSPLWRERYPRLATVMDNDPLLPMGNQFHENILVSCEKPFGLSKDVQEQWLDRDNNPQLSVEDFPFLATQGELDLSQLPVLWKEVSGFAPIPIDRIGPSSDSGQQ